MSFEQFLVGDTMKVTWINSGVTPTALVAKLYTGSETVVGSTSMTSSGDGHYFAAMTMPDTPGFYVLETLATIDGFPYKRRVKVQAVVEDVD